MRRRETPRSVASLALFAPAAAAWRTLAICSSVRRRARPLCTPRALARSIPSRWRSRMRERLSSATAPMSWRWNVANGSAVASSEKVRRSLTNSTLTWRAVRSETICSRSISDRAGFDPSMRRATCHRGARTQRIRQASAIGSALARLVVSEQLVDRPSASSCLARFCDVDERRAYPAIRPGMSSPYPQHGQ